MWFTLCPELTFCSSGCVARYAPSQSAEAEVLTLEDAAFWPGLVQAALPEMIPTVKEGQWKEDHLPADCKLGKGLGCILLWGWELTVVGFSEAIPESTTAVPKLY